MSDRNEGDIIDPARLTRQEQQAIDYLAKGDHQSAVTLKGFKGGLEEYKAEWISHLTYGELPGLVQDFKDQILLDYSPERRSEGRSF
jgi:hypothetical protein